MKIVDHNYTAKTETSVALGFFDGMHIGHTKVIKEAVKKGKGLTASVFTFNVRPYDVIFKTKTPQIISQEQKNKLFEELGVKIVIKSDFKEILDMSSEEFVLGYLKDRLRAKEVVCGFNFTFGKNKEGDINKLKRLCKQADINLTVVNPVICDNNEVVSSSIIREYIKTGRIEKANYMMGRELSFESEIVKGNQIGKKWGFPTANQIIPEDRVCPKYGVYVSKVSFDDYETFAITNIGVKPTIGSLKPLIESYMPFYKGEDIYGKVVNTRVIKFLREEKKFDNAQILKKQISSDIESFFDYIG